MSNSTVVRTNGCSNHTTKEREQTMKILNVEENA